MYNGRIILAGNPNVGKSTLFNHITGKKVHTGNWSGKTVSVSTGYGVHNNKKYLIEDLPGIASVTDPTGEEISAFQSIISGNYQCCIIVADATNLPRSLCLALRILELTPRCVLCVNLCDEAAKKGIRINPDKLSFILGIPVVLTSAKKKACIHPLMSAAADVCEGNIPRMPFVPLYPEKTENELSRFPFDRSETISKLISSPNSYTALRRDMALHISLTAQKIAAAATTKKHIAPKYDLDKIFCSHYFGIPIMLFLLCLILYTTIVLSNYPSEALSLLFKKVGDILEKQLILLSFPPFLVNILIQGAYYTTATVVAVMLPPMVIFFPLFALLEDSGYLPRVAFNLDNTFAKCGSCGKQSLSICMGLGCNCIGISNSAIIPSKRERLIAVLTNSFTPCNGRFGSMIACVSIFLAPSSPTLGAFIMLCVLIFSFLSTLLASKLLSETILKGKNETFVLELPSYRKPQFFKVIFTSICENTPKILLRAISVACPVGVLICILNSFSLLFPLADFLEPLASLMGLDGVILLSFILAFPANEIVFPILLMLYTHSSGMVEYSSTAALGSILFQNGWGISTAISFIIFTLMHFPCSAAVLTVKKETGSAKWALASVVLPLLFGILFCVISNLIFKII